MESKGIHNQFNKAYNIQSYHVRKRKKKRDIKDRERKREKEKIVPHNFYNLFL